MNKEKQGIPSDLHKKKVPLAQEQKVDSEREWKEGGRKDTRQKSSAVVQSSDGGGCTRVVRVDMEFLCPVLFLSFSLVFCPSPQVFAHPLQSVYPLPLLSLPLSLYPLGSQSLAISLSP